MRRRLFTLCTALSLLLWAALLILWARSYFVTDGVSWSNERLLLHKGQVVWIMDRSLGARRASVVRVTSAHDYAFASPFLSAPSQLTNWDWRFLGFHFQSQNGAPMISSNSNWLVEIARVYAVPFWALLLLFTPLPLIWIIRRGRERRLARAGLCDICGYDLRASPERCPECGAVVTHIAHSKLPA